MLSTTAHQWSDVVNGRCWRAAIYTWSTCPNEAVRAESQRPVSAACGTEESTPGLASRNAPALTLFAGKVCPGAPRTDPVGTAMNTPTLRTLLINNATHATGSLRPDKRPATNYTGTLLGHARVALCRVPNESASTGCAGALLLVVAGITDGTVALVVTSASTTLSINGTAFLALAVARTKFASAGHAVPQLQLTGHKHTAGTSSGCGSYSSSSVYRPLARSSSSRGCSNWPE